MVEATTERNQSMSPPAGPTASVTGLLRSLADDITRLFAQEVALAKTEVSGAVRDIKSGVLSMAIGLGVLFAGFIILLVAAVLGLALFFVPWLAALIVGGVVCLIGIILLMSAKKSLDPQGMVPNRTIESLRRDEAMVKRAVS